VHFLNNTALTDRDGKWRVLGTTLWTDFSLCGAGDAALRESIAAAERVILDYRGVIQVLSPELEAAPRSFTPRDSLVLHQQARHGWKMSWQSPSMARRLWSRIVRRSGKAWRKSSRRIEPRRVM